MNDYNSDLYNTTGNTPENNSTGGQPQTEPDIIDVSATEETVIIDSTATDNTVSASESSAETASTGSSPYFNRLHEEPAENQSCYNVQNESQDSTYHYSYVKQQEESPVYSNKQNRTSEYNYSQNTASDHNYSQNGPSDYNQSASKKTRKKGSKRNYILKLVASALAFGLIAGAAFQGFNFVYYKINPSANPSGSTIQSTPTLTITGDTVSTTTDLSAMVENVMPSIVSITSIVEQQINYGFWGSSTQEAEGAGSGIIIGQNDTELLVVTNYHVIEDAKSISVGFIDESDAVATVKGYDSDADLAVVSVALDNLSSDTKSAIKVATLGKSSALKVGEPAIAIGNALGYGQSVTAGYVSALDREVALTDKTMTLLQTDAAINPGNSGGALLNIKGEVIGINTVKYSDTTVEGMGYAIPIDTAAPIIEALMNKETIPESEQAYMGITGSNITESYSQQLNLPQGIYIQAVQENSPADKGGIHAGDVITKFNGNSVSTMENLIGKLEGFRAGDEVTVTVKRLNNHGQYEELDLNITLGAKSELQ